MTLKITGEPKKGFERDVGAKATTARSATPITNVNADPISDRIAMRVTPGERFMASTSSFLQQFLVREVIRKLSGKPVRCEKKSGSSAFVAFYPSHESS
jgi:hypothetical protein